MFFLCFYIYIYITRVGHLHVYVYLAVRHRRRRQPCCCLRRKRSPPPLKVELGKPGAKKLKKEARHLDLSTWMRTEIVQQGNSTKSLSAMRRDNHCPPILWHGVGGVYIA